MDIMIISLWIFCSLAVWIIYHNLFCVIYFDLFNGCLKELIVALFLGTILTAVVIRYWLVFIFIVMLLGFVFIKKH